MLYGPRLENVRTTGYVYCGIEGHIDDGRARGGYVNARKGEGAQGCRRVSLVDCPIVGVGCSGRCVTLCDRQGATASHSTSRGGCAAKMPA